MLRSLPNPVVKALPFAAPLMAVALARWATYSTWATENPGWTAALYAWVVADALMLALLAKAPQRRPQAIQVLGVLSLASLVILLGASGPVRDVYLSLPSVLIAAAGTVTLFVAWSGVRVASQWRQSGSIQQALESVLPGPLVRFALSEARMIWLDLFRWNAPVDAPKDAQAFAYHTYLVPMIATFLALQVIELGVVHLLVMLWWPAIAWVLLALSVWGLIWTTALLKSLRIKPVLLRADSVQIRSGMIADFPVPLAAIADTNTPFTTEELEGKGVMNLALLSSPNVHLRFATPLRVPSFLGGEKEIAGVALKLDDSGAFLNALDERLHQTEPND